MIFLSKQARTLLKISFLTTFAESMLVPMYATFTDKVGGSILDAGIAFAVFSMATGIVVTLLGTRPFFQLHIKRFLMMGFLVSAGCDISYIFVQNKWQLFGAQIIAGLGTGLIEPAWDALFTDDIEHSSLPRWSVWAGGTHFVTGVAAVLGGLIVAYGSFTGLFTLMSLIDVVALYIAWNATFTAEGAPPVAPEWVDVKAPRVVPDPPSLRARR